VLTLLEKYSVYNITRILEILLYQQKVRLGLDSETGLEGHHRQGDGMGRAIEVGSVRCIPVHSAHTIKTMSQG
jgi:hypothetical protein